MLFLHDKFIVDVYKFKTSTLSSIPLLPPAIKILAKYSFHPDTIRTGKLLPVISNQKSNAYLKEIATICGIEKNLFFHLARHTFDITVTQSNGILIESVSKVLRLRSLKTTQNYAKVIDKKLRADMEVVKVKYVTGQKEEKSKLSKQSGHQLDFEF